jgi:NitT/TauT family transport system permease protein
MVLAYSLSFIVVMLAIEKLLLQPWERRATRWRTA